MTATVMAFVQYEWRPSSGAKSTLRSGTDGRRITDFSKIRDYVLNRDGHACHYCGATATHVDHVWPRKYRGPDCTDNLVAACAPCNQAKGDQVRYDLMTHQHWALLLDREARLLEERAEEILRLAHLLNRHAAVSDSGLVRVAAGLDAEVDLLRQIIAILPVEMNYGLDRDGVRS